VEGLEPALRIRHAITNTNYYVQVFSARSGAAARALRSAVPADSRELQWTRTASLASLPLTGLTRKILQRLKVMKNKRVALPG